MNGAGAGVCKDLGFRLVFLRTLVKANMVDWRVAYNTLGFYLQPLSGGQETDSGAERENRHRAEQGTPAWKHLRTSFQRAGPGDPAGTMAFSVRQLHVSLGKRCVASTPLALIPID